ncbi:hypothetical protein J3R30DRAFT_2583565 [Lentinula aciculospora]|uniref:DUF6534 domain-containing protein n=1 Tax=Lentinula aciculospora TaxID=153920 RepID=A0A9W9DPD7_9AGAR|nr:hypothetical protein J3R30DRAFT_2583565 [Lentinula aciculospora]
MGVAYIGMVAAAFLLGCLCSTSSFALLLISTLVSCLQAFTYFSEQCDTRAIRSLVALVVFFDLVHQALISHTVYYYLISNYANPSALGLAVWSLLAEVLFNGFTAFCVQSFLTWRIWRLSNSNVWITSVVYSLVMAEFGCVLSFGIIALVRVRTFAELATDLKGLSITVNALAAVSDVIIAGILTFLLQKSKTGFQRSDTMLNKLTVFAVNTGALTSFCAVASLISILAAPNTFIYILFFFCMGRLYTNSLLATLNARKKIRAGGDNIQTTSGQNFSFSFNKSFTKPSSFSSYPSKKQTGEISIQIDTTQELRAQDYASRHTLSKQEEEYELGNSSTGNLSHGDVESTVSSPTLPNEDRFNAV